MWMEVYHNTVQTYIDEKQYKHEVIMYNQIWTGIKTNIKFT